MSRAFIREAEPGEPTCPGCGGSGDPVGAATLQAHVAPEAAASLGERAWYCPDPDCRTAYFNGWGAAVAREAMAATAWPKDPLAPICPWFGITAGEVLADAHAGRKERVRDLVARAKGPEARCLQRCPDGLPCVPRVLRLFRERLEPRP